MRLGVALDGGRSGVTTVHRDRHRGSLSCFTVSYEGEHTVHHLTENLQQNHTLGGLLGRWKQSSMSPLGLLTLANMFPKDYNVRLVDMNVRPLTDADLQ
jgi:hypothetical protein